MLISDSIVGLEPPDDLTDGCSEMFMEICEKSIPADPGNLSVELPVRSGGAFHVNPLTSRYGQECAKRGDVLRDSTSGGEGRSVFLEDRAEFHHLVRR